MNLAYHGAGFAGWAAQPGMRTVQGELEVALERILGGPIPLTVAGRTDAGVHAWGQVASFQLDRDPPEELGRALNSQTGPDLAVISAEPTAEGFDARRDARSRTYCYRLLSARTSNPFETGVSLFWPHRVDPAAARTERHRSRRGSRFGRRAGGSNRCATARHAERRSPPLSARR